MVPEWFADLPPPAPIDLSRLGVRTLGAVKLWTGHRLAWGRVSQSPVTRLGGVNKQQKRIENVKILYPFSVGAVIPPYRKRPSANVFQLLSIANFKKPKSLNEYLIFSTSINLSMQAIKSHTPCRLISMNVFWSSVEPKYFVQFKG